MYTILLLILAVILWVQNNPQKAIGLVKSVKKRYRNYLIKKHGTRKALMLFEYLRHEADKREIDPALVEEFIEKNGDSIALKLGKEKAEEILGKPTIFEGWN